LHGNDVSGPYGSPHKKCSDDFLRNVELDDVKEENQHSTDLEPT
jgi:hypothetical protein